MYEFIRRHSLLPDNDVSKAMQNICKTTVAAIFCAGTLRQGVYGVGGSAGAFPVYGAKLSRRSPVQI